MPRKKTRTITPDTLTSLDSLTAKLAAVARMRTGELIDTYRELFGTPTRSRNNTYLRNEIARKLQELTEGGLSARAEMRISELGDELPERWRRKLTRKEARFVETVTARDPRLPEPGTILERAYGGKVHQVVVRFVDFEYEGQSYKTLSSVARAITGANWNGFEFFKLEKRGRS